MKASIQPSRLQSKDFAIKLAVTMHKCFCLLQWGLNSSDADLRNVFKARVRFRAL